MFFRVPAAHCCVNFLDGGAIFAPASEGNDEDGAGLNSNEGLAPVDSKAETAPGFFHGFFSISIPSIGTLYFCGIVGPAEFFELP
jgi:hypothetical protein